MLPALAAAAAPAALDKVSTAAAGTTSLLVDAVDPNSIAIRKKLASDRARLLSGDLGPSQAQRAAMIGDYARVAQAGADNTQAELDRAAAATGGTRAGNYYSAKLQVANNTQANIAKHAGQVENIAAQQADAEKQNILSRLDAERARTIGMWSKFAGSAGEAAGAMVKPKTINYKQHDDVYADAASGEK